MRSYFVNQLALNGLARDCQKHPSWLYHCEGELLEYIKWQILQTCPQILEEHEPLSQYLLVVGQAAAQRMLHEYVIEQEPGDYTCYAWPHVEARMQNFLDRFYRCNEKQQLDLIRLADSVQRRTEVKLSPKEEIILVTCYHCGLSPNEAGRRLGVSGATINAIVSRIRKKLEQYTARS